MYYSIFDIEGKDYLNAGRNSTDKNQCIKEGAEFVFDNADEEDYVQVLKSDTDTQELLLLNAGYRIEEHKEIITDYLDFDESMDGDFDNE